MALFPANSEGSGTIEDVASLFTNKPTNFYAEKKNGVVWFRGTITGGYGYLAQFNNNAKINPHSDLLYSTNGYFNNSQGYRQSISVTINSTGIYYTSTDGASHECIISGCYLAAN